MKFRTIVLFLAALLVATAAMAATDPPPTDQLAAALDRLADLLERGGPAVIAGEVVLGIAFLATLAAVVLVIITVVQALPRAARPLADAWATAWGRGATQREEALRVEKEALRSENSELRTEVEVLTGKVQVLEHADVEHRQIVGALLDRLEAGGMDVAVVRAMYHPAAAAAE